MESIDTKGDNIEGEEDTNFREKENKERMRGKINITIKMHVNRKEDSTGKIFMRLKRGKDIKKESKEKRWEEGKDRDKEEENQGSGEENE